MNEQLSTGCWGEILALVGTYAAGVLTAVIGFLRRKKK